MFSKTMTNVFAGMLLVSSAPAFAQLGVSVGGGGGGGVSVGGIGVGGGAGGGVGGSVGGIGGVGGVGGNVGVGMNVGVGTNIGASTNASANGSAHANHNSVLGEAGGVAAGGLATGMTVMSSAGAQIGTVSKVVTNRHGLVTKVLVKADGGGTVSLAPHSLSVNGSGALVTTAKIRGK